MNDLADDLKETEQTNDELAASTEPDMLLGEPETAVPTEDGDESNMLPNTEEIEDEAIADVDAGDEDMDDIFPEPQSLETAALEIHPDLDNPLFNLAKIGAASEAGEQTMVVAKRCFKGAVRERNEDSCLVFTSETGGHFPILPFGLYVVADGMGGHKNGHIASKTASRIAARQVIERVYMPLLQVESVPSSTPIVEVLEDAVESAHRALYDPTEQADTGTTLTVALVLGRRLYVAHVGDTRLYLWHNDKLEKVTTDHSLVQRLQDVGQLTAEEATFYQYRHVLLRAVGQGEDLAVDTYTRRLPKAGKLLLCTDGVSGLIPEFEIGMILQQDKPADDIAEELMDAAMDAGGYDNITAIVVDFQLG